MYFSKKLGINYLLIGSLFVLPYLLIFTFVVNSEGMLSLIFMIIALSLESENKWQSGIFIGLAGLAKYTSLIFLPIILLLQGRKNIFKGFLSFVIVTLPWLIFNYIVFKNPIYSYLSSISVSLESSAPSAISLVALFYVMIFFVPAIIILALLLYWYFKERNKKSNKNKKKVYEIFREKIFKRPLLILLSFLFLSIVEFIILGMHESSFDQSRYAYFLYSAVAFLIAYGIDKVVPLVKINKTYIKRIFIYKSDIILFLFSASSILVVLIILNSGGYGNFTSGSQNVIFENIASELKELNIYNCPVVSNDWVYLRYYNITAFSPYFYNNSIKNYSVVVINSIGTSPNDVYIDFHKKVYLNSSFSIYMSNSSSRSNC
ncbi:MAG: glycosyltransferase 87 family protein [Candidatus Micrarchaeia archaeon]